jgi:thiosulfate/3-mercaptopyruvate sulfurtransferase
MSCPDFNIFVQLFTWRSYGSRGKERQERFHDPELRFMGNQLMTLTTKQVLALLENPRVKMIDVRPMDAYNGWRLKNEARGGHIRGAKSLPFKWTTYLDWPDIVRTKGLRPTDTLIIYSYGEPESKSVAEHFLRTGYENIMVYNDFLAGWCGDPALPMTRLARYRQLVSAGWLNSLIASGAAPEYDNDNYVVCHAHYRNRSAYEEGHVPGAIDLDTNTLETPETWNRRSPSELKETLERAGITADTTVILYGRSSVADANDPFPGSSAGHLGAMRCAFIMLYAGVKDVRILNGGLQAWIDEGLATTTEDSPRKPVDDFGARIPQCPELAVDLEEAKLMLQSPEQNLVCVRSWREYIGEVSGYNYIHKKGRIPGALFADCGSDAYHMENYRNIDHTTREFREIEKLWAQAGIIPEKRNAFYCGTGWRAGEAFVNAWLMGWPRISVFDGGWFEWSNDENNPYETGIPGRATAVT